MCYVASHFSKLGSSLLTYKIQIQWQFSNSSKNSWPFWLRTLLLLDLLFYILSLSNRFFGQFKQTQFSDTMKTLLTEVSFVLAMRLLLISQFQLSNGRCRYSILTKVLHIIFLILFNAFKPTIAKVRILFTVLI